MLLYLDVAVSTAHSLPRPRFLGFGIFALFGRPWRRDRQISFAQCTFSGLNQCRAGGISICVARFVPPELAHALIYVPVHARPNTLMHGCGGMRTECCVEQPSRALALLMLPQDAEY